MSQPESTKRCDICGREKMRGSDPRANQCNPAYMTSAAAFHRLSYERVSRALAEAETLKRISDSQAHEAWIERDGALARLAEAEKERDEARDALEEVAAARKWIADKTGVGGGTRPLSFITASHDYMACERRAAEERAAQAERLLREAREALRDAFLLIARQNPLSIPEIKRIDRVSAQIDAALQDAATGRAPKAPPDSVAGGGAQGEEK